MKTPTKLDLLYWMSTPRVAVSWVITLALAIYFNIIAAQQYIASGMPVSLFESQLSFSAEAVKGFHQVLLDVGSITLYRQVQYLDFGLMFFSGLALWLTGILISRGLSNYGRMQRLALLGGLLAGVSAFCDLIENGFLLTMLSNPLNFADWLAIAYSTAALLKFATSAVGLIGMLIALAALIYTRLTGRSKALAFD